MLQCNVRDFILCQHFPTPFQLKFITRYNQTTDSCEGVEPGSPWHPALPDDTLFNSGEDDVLFFYGEPGKEEVSQSRYRASCLK